MDESEDSTSNDVFLTDLGSLLFGAIRAEVRYVPDEPLTMAHERIAKLEEALEQAYNAIQKELRTRQGQPPLLDENGKPRGGL